MGYPSVTTSLKKYRGKWGRAEAKHLLKRTLFGATKADIDFFVSKSLRHSIQQLLNTTETLPAPPVNNYNDDKYTDEEIQPGQTWITATKVSGMNSGRRRNSLKAWWMGLMLNQQRTLREKMVMFWHNHFATETNNVDNPTMCFKHNMLLRGHALGNFKQLVRAVTIDPAMLKYLNGNANTKYCRTYMAFLTPVVMTKPISSSLLFTVTRLSKAARVKMGNKSWMTCST
jgi:uncharacterized protein (DUF1800 family)